MILAAALISMKQIVGGKNILKQILKKLINSITKNVIARIEVLKE